MSPRARRRAHGGGEEHGPGMERWLLTYADMITLLLALFVILFALSTINAKKFLAFKLGLSQTFSNQVAQPKQSTGLLPDQNSLLSHPSTPTSQIPDPLSTSAPTPPASQIAAELDQALAAAGLSSYASTTITKQGVVVQMLADKAYFATDSATLGAIGDEIVDTIGGVLRTVGNDVEVQGYTDNQPITGGPFTSNWELSAVRAANVVQRLDSTDGIEPARLSATGYGTTRAVASNASPAGQAENRRIDVVILTPTSASPATTTSSTATGSTGAAKTAATAKHAGGAS